MIIFVEVLECSQKLRNTTNCKLLFVVTKKIFSVIFGLFTDLHLYAKLPH